MKKTLFNMFLVVAPMLTGLCAMNPAHEYDGLSVIDENTEDSRSYGSDQESDASAVEELVDLLASFDVIETADPSYAPNKPVCFSASNLSEKFSPHEYQRQKLQAYERCLIRQLSSDKRMSRVAREALEVELAQVQDDLHGALDAGYDLLGA